MDFTRASRTQNLKWSIPLTLRHIKLHALTEEILEFYE